MKKTYLLLIITVVLFSCGQQKKPQGAKIAFENTECNIGKIKQGERTECCFTVKNIGDSTLFFNQIIPSCDCTSFVNINDSVPAGQSYTLKFMLDTYGKELGAFESDIRIVTNTIPDLHHLKIKAEIE